MCHAAGPGASTCASSCAPWSPMSTKALGRAPQHVPCASRERQRALVSGRVLRVQELRAGAGVAPCARRVRPQRKRAARVASQGQLRASPAPPHAPERHGKACCARRAWSSSFTLSPRSAVWHVPRGTGTAARAVHCSFLATAGPKSRAQTFVLCCCRRGNCAGRRRLGCVCPLQRTRDAARIRVCF